jgi:hypothetical protein
MSKAHLDKIVHEASRDNGWCHSKSLSRGRPGYGRDDQLAIEVTDHGTRNYPSAFLGFTSADRIKVSPVDIIMYVICSLGAGHWRVSTDVFRLGRLLMCNILGTRTVTHWLSPRHQPNV